MAVSRSAWNQRGLVEKEALVALVAMVAMVQNH